ncbi:MAG: amidohydrolase [Gammaproteobacteria bacterium]
MKPFVPVFGLLLLAACNGAQESGPAPVADSSAVTDVTAADAVYINGRIYTVDAAQAWAEAVAIQGGKFLAVGSNADVQALVGGQTKVIDLGGKFAMPGLHDTHVHPVLVYVNEESGELQYPESTPPDEQIKLIREFADNNPDLQVIRSNKWSTADFPDGKATKEWLDPHFPDRAIYAIDETGHNAVLNSAALELAGISKDTPDPEFGAIDRDPETGEPTGYVSETAMMLIGKLVERPDVDANYRAISRAMDEIRAYGNTSVIDMLVGPNGVAAYQQLERDGKLNMRANLAVPMNDYQAEATTEEESEALIARRDEINSPLLNVSIKFFADGTPFSQTALMVEPYADDPTTRGEMTIGERQFARIKQAQREGVQVRMHATTDGTTRTLLDVIEEARAEHGNLELRHHIGHLLTVTKEDVPRFKELNVIAEFSPIWFYPTAIGDIATIQIGAARYARWQAIKEFVDAGVTVTIGSDWPAGTPNADPWKGMEGMVTRMDPAGDMPGKLGEGIELEQAIEIMTINGAKATMSEDKVGSIEVGKFADMIILDRNLLEIPITDVSETKVLTTVMNGEVVYERP